MIKTTQSHSPAIDGVQTPTQERARRTMIRILDSTEELLAHSPVDSLALGAVLKNAGVSNGAFYSRFRDREALIAALFDRFRVRSALSIEENLDLENWKGRSPREPVAALVRVLMQLYREQGGLIRALRDLARHQSVYRTAAADMITETSRSLARALYAATWRKPSPAFEDEVRFAVRVLFAFLDQALLFGPLSPDKRERADREIETRLIGLMLKSIGLGQLL